MDIDKKIKEAELYHAMGMLDEALLVYETLLAADTSGRPEDRPFLEEKTRKLKKEIETVDQASLAELSSEKLALIQRGVGSGDRAADHLDSAAAFVELGLHAEAACEYEKILALGREASKGLLLDAVTGRLRCLMATAPPEEVLRFSRRLAEAHGLSGEECEEIRRRLGGAEETRGGGGGGRAVDIFGPAGKDHLRGSAAGKEPGRRVPSRTPDSKYAYLLEKGIVTPRQLKIALDMSKKTKRSVAGTLIQQFNVAKTDVGESLARFYRCPFRAFDPDLPVPAALIGNLKKAFLVHDAWVPLGRGEAGIDVLVDDPADLVKTDHIRTLMPAEALNLFVGVREDIVRYIKRFFALAGEKGRGEDADNLESIIADVLQFISQTGKTGVLRARQGPTEYQIYFLAGNIVYAIQPFKLGRLGRLLTRDGVVTQEIVDTCLAEANRRRLAIGKILLERGHIAFKTLEAYIHEQIREIICAMFRWETGEFFFEDTQFNLRWLVVVELDTMNLIVEALEWNRAPR